MTANPQWRDWGPYLAERAWGTVREDYNANGDPLASYPQRAFPYRDLIAGNAARSMAEPEHELAHTGIFDAMGLDNIGPLNRSTLPPEVGYLEQADSTAWVAMYALDLLKMALLLAAHDPSYEGVRAVPAATRVT